MSLLSSLRKSLIKKYPLFQGCAPCPDNHIGWQALSGRVPDPRFPIDFVFTWVNDADPKLIAKRNQHISLDKLRSQESQGASLYRNSDELRYALRSLEAYAPWIRRIFIITDDQTPNWLSPKNCKVRIVNHTECIPSAFLPTFNSHVIEAYLHNIPGLSEHFVYCNDDFFLLNQCSKADFFTPNGLPFLYVDWRQRRRQGYEQGRHKPHVASFFNTLGFLRQYGIVIPPTIIPAHAPYPLTKSGMKAACTFFQPLINDFVKNKFRTLNDLALPCHAAPLLAYAQKQTVPRDVPYYYINSKRFDRMAYYEAMLREKDLGSLPPFLCLNDVGDGVKGDSWRADMQSFLQAYFPSPASFEKQ